MTAAAAQLLSCGVYLQACLKPFEPALARPDVTDIYVNGPGELWIETLDGKIERHPSSAINDETLARLARQIAAATAQGISREHPLLSGKLPDGSRIQIVGPPATRGPFALAIRRFAAPLQTLEDYTASGAFAGTRSDETDARDDRELDGLITRGSFGDALALAVRNRKNIVISGGTSSGKTTFLNALLREIPRGERLIFIEDTPELEIEHDNGVGLLAVRGELGQARVTMDDLLSASLRMRPDRIILGELRGPEALAFLRAVNSGHPGSMTTIHADSAAGALEQLAMLVLQAGTTLNRADVHAYARQSIDLVVQLSRVGGRRSVEMILPISGRASLQALAAAPSGS